VINITGRSDNNYKVQIKKTAKTGTFTVDVRMTAKFMSRWHFWGNVLYLLWYSHSGALIVWCSIV